MAKFMRGHREKAGSFFVAVVVLQQPYFFLVEMDVSAAISTRKERMCQNLASPIEWISIAVMTTMKVNQNIRPIAVNLLKSKLRVSRPEIEGSA